MANITYPHDLVNDTLADADQVMDNFEAISAQVNGNIEGGNLADNAVTTAKIGSAQVTDVKLASPNNSVWHTLQEGSIALNGGSAAGTYMVPQDGVLNPGAGWNAGEPSKAIYLDPADYVVANKTTRYRLRAQVWTNSVSPGTNLTFLLSHVSDIITVGPNDEPDFDANVTGSTAALGTTGPLAIHQVASSEFTIGAAGHHAVRLTIDTLTAAGSVPLLSYQLQRRAT